MDTLKALLKKLFSDKWYFLAAIILLVLLLLIMFHRMQFLSLVSVPAYQIQIGGETYLLDLFDGILFGLFITLTIVAAWYFGGHAAFMFTAISWNFEIALFMILTARVELMVEFSNLIAFVALYAVESPADKKRRRQTEAIKNANEELIKLTESYSRFVPLEFLKLLKKERITEVALGEAVQKQLSIMFADIRSFVSISEKLPPHLLFEFLNGFLKDVGPLVRKHNGFIDKYLGDGVMALFPDSPEDALNCAMELQKVVQVFNKRMRMQDKPEIQLGSGIHCGISMLGTIGDDYRMDSTVIADAVNLSSRLEGLTKVYGADIIVSQQMLDALQKPYAFKCRFLDRTFIKGKSEEINIYEIIDSSKQSKNYIQPEYLNAFETAAQNYHKGLVWDSFNIFNKLSESYPEDKAVLYYLDRCKTHIQLHKS